MKCFITGAAGFIGSSLAERLLILGNDVIGIDNLNPYYDKAIKEANLKELNINKRFTFIQQDIFDADMNKLTEGADHIYHVAAQPGNRASYDNVDEYIRNNIFATAKLLDAAKKNKTRKVVFASSSSIYGELSIYPFREVFPIKPVSPYAMTKMKAEELCLMYHKEDKVPVVILRYFAVYGPKQRPDMAMYRMIKSALSGEKFILYGDGTYERDFVYIADAVSATLKAAQMGRVGEIYNIGTENTVSMNDLVKTVEMVTSKNIKIENQAVSKGDMKKTQADISKVKTELGYLPMVGLKEGIQKQVDWMKKLK